jgi:hypothetical protein
MAAIAQAMNAFNNSMGPSQGMPPPPSGQQPGQLPSPMDGAGQAMPAPPPGGMMGAYPQPSGQQPGQLPSPMDRAGQAGTGNLMPGPPAQGAAPPGAYPQPDPSVLPPASPFAPFQGPMPTPPASPAPGLGGAPGTNGPGLDGIQPGPLDIWNPNEKNQYGGQQIAGADPSQADYNSVQGYADQAYDESQRYMAPQHAQEDRRMQQELINKGIDPNSPQGKEMQNMLAMQQGDQQNAAQFGALGFGQGIQNQMSQQEQFNQGLAGNMQQALWQNQLGSSGQGLQKYLGDQSNKLGQMGLQNQRYGMDQNYALGQAGQDLQRYGMDQNNQIAQGQLDMGRQGQDFSQMSQLEQNRFRDQAYGDSRGDRQQDILMQLLGFNAPGQAGMIDPTGFGGATMNSAGGDKGILGNFFG